jgi:cytochrome P450
MGQRRAITLPMFGDGIFTQEGIAWKHSREILRPQFVYKQYENLDIFKQAAEDLLEEISDVATSREGIVDLQPLFFRLTLDTTTSFLFGESIRCLKQPEDAGEQTFASAFNLAQEYVARRFRVADFYWLIGGYKFRQACKKIHQFADNIIDRNLSKAEQQNSDDRKYVFLQSLAQCTPDRVALRGQIVNILAAGRDTTACLLAWTL